MEAIMLKKARSFLGQGVFGTPDRDAQDVAEYLFFIAVLVGIIETLSSVISGQFQTQAAKLFQTK
jgi:hypothetical protein